MVGTCNAASACLHFHAQPSCPETSTDILWYIYPVSDQPAGCNAYAGAVARLGIWGASITCAQVPQELTNPCDRKRWSHFHVAEKVNKCLFSFGAMSVLGALLSFSVPLFIASLLPLLVHCLTSTILVHEEHL